MNSRSKALLKSLQDEQAKRTFFFLPTLDGYVFREFMIPFSVLLFAFLFLFLIGDIFNDLNDFLDAKAGFGTITKFFLLKMPGNIRFVLPISILLSCMYTFANFGRNNEIAAMRASGLSLIRCGFPMYVVGFIVMLVNFWFNEQVIPYTNQEANFMQKVAKDPHYEKRMYNMLQFRSVDKCRDWLFQNFNGKGTHTDVVLKKYAFNDDGTKDLVYDIRAAESNYDPEKGWIFRDAVKTPYNSLLHLAGQPEKYPTLVIPASEIPEKPQDIINAVRPPDELPAITIYRLLRESSAMVPALKGMYETLLYYRIAFPTVCFLCVFLALPLAAKNERSGVFLSIITAVAAVVVYQVLTEVFLLLGKTGIVPPLVGGLTPTIVFLLYGYIAILRKAG